MPTPEFISHLFKLLTSGSLRKHGIVSTVLSVVIVLLLGKRRLQRFVGWNRIVSNLREQVPFVTENTGRVGWIAEVVQQRYRINDYMVEQTAKIGPTWYAGHFLVVTDPKDVEYILKGHFDNYNKGEDFVTNFRDLLGDGIFNANGEVWRLQRKTASKIFTQNAFSTFMRDIFVEHGELVCSHLAAIADRPNIFIDMQKEFQKFTLDSIGKIGFGLSFGCLTQETVPFADAFDASQQQIINRFLNPFWQMGRSVGVSPGEWDYDRYLKVIDEFTNPIIQQRKNEPAHIRDKRLDILTFFLNRTDEEGKPFTDKFLRDIVMNFIIAGRDTTAVTLTWAVYVISQHPKVEARLMDEIDEVLQGQAPTFDQVDKQMPYLHAVVNETLRLYPPVPKDVKYAVNDDMLPTGVLVPKGTTVVYTPYVMNRDPKRWPDPLTFNPDRWLVKGFKQPTSFEFPVFQAGPRTCLGKHMAYTEAKMLLSMIYQKFSLQLKPGTVVEPEESVTLPMRYPLTMSVLRRPSSSLKQASAPKPKRAATKKAAKAAEPVVDVNQSEEGTVSANSTSNEGLSTGLSGKCPVAHL